MALVEIEQARRNGRKTGRALHTRDFWLEGTRQFQRRIRNGSCWETSSGIIDVSAPAIPLQLSEPPEWQSGKAFDFWRWSRAGQAQVGVGNVNSPGIPYVGIQRSDAPEDWYTLRLYRVGEVGSGMQAASSSTPIADTGAKRVRWPDIGTGARFDLTVFERGFAKDIVYQAAPEKRFEFTVLLADGVTHSVVNNQLILKRNGETRIATRPPFVRDETGNPNNFLAATLTELSPVTIGQRTFPRIALDAPDTSHLSGDMHLDPTSLIQGTTALEDALLGGNATGRGYNYGGLLLGWVGWYDGGTYADHIWRLADPSNDLPTGTINSATAYLYVTSVDVVSGTCTFNAHAVKSGNSAWGEGNKTGATPATGECSWKLRDSPNAWLGGALGCSVVGIDVDAGTEDTLAITTTGWKTIDTAASRMESIRSSGTDPGQVYLTADGYSSYPGTRRRIIFESTEAAANQFYLSVDYTAGGGGGGGNLVPGINNAPFPIGGYYGI